MAYKGTLNLVGLKKRIGIDDNTYIKKMIKDHGLKKQEQYLFVDPQLNQVVGITNISGKTNLRKDIIFSNLASNIAISSDQFMFKSLPGEEFR